MQWLLTDTDVNLSGFDLQRNLVDCRQTTATLSVDGVDGGFDRDSGM